MNSALQRSNPTVEVSQFSIRPRSFPAAPPLGRAANRSPQGEQALGPRAVAPVPPPRGAFARVAGMALPP
jgi:hypothetical protein